MNNNTYRYIDFDMQALKSTPGLPEKQGRPPKKVCIISLNRPDKANAFNAKIIDELCMAVAQAESNKSDLLILRANGKHFSAGADLQWMKKSAELTYEQNIEDARKLFNLMWGIYRFSAPTFAIVEGAAFGGALGIIAACDFAFGGSRAKFCLSEVKLGLLPAVIYPFVAFKLGHAKTRQLGLNAQVFEAQEAMHWGLLSHISADDASHVNRQTSEQIPTWKTIANEILGCGPQAQRLLKQISQKAQLLSLGLKSDLVDSLLDKSANKIDWSLVAGNIFSDCINAIAEARTSAEGQDGLSSFFEKTQPSYHTTWE